MATEVVPTTDPYDISTQVQEFKEAYYGEDVRDGIINLANKLNNELNDLSTHEFVSVDDTLSVQGAGADAKATGDALAARDAAIALKADKTNALLSGKTRIAGSLSCGDNAPLGNSGVALGLGLTNNGGFGERIVLGMNNQAENDKLLIVGNGDYYGEDTKSNAMTLDYDGNAWFAGKIKVGGANYAGGSELATQAYVDAAAEHVEVETATIVGAYLRNHTDSTPTAGSANFVTSDGVKSYVDSSTPSITVEQTVTQGSANAVSGGAVYSAIPQISTNVTSDASSDAKTVSPKAVKDYVDSAISAAITSAIGGSY